MAYFSKILGQRARSKPIYEKELMAIVLAIQKWRHFLLGRHFVVRTDQKSLKYLLEQREVGQEYQRWLSKLLGYSFDIQYKPGATNKVADAFSREFPATAIYCALSSTCGVTWEYIQQQIEQDTWLHQLKTSISQGQTVPKWFTVDHGVLKYKDRIVLPRGSELTARILKEYHDSPIGGHSGDYKTYQRISSEWYWPGLRKDVTKYVLSCSVCQQQKSSSFKSYGPSPAPSYSRQGVGRCVNGLRRRITKVQWLGHNFGSRR